MSSSGSDDQLKASQPVHNSPPEVIAISKSAHPKRSIWRTVVSQIFGITWLAAIIVLLVFNFRGWILGASVTCGIKTNCDFDPFRPDAFRKAEEMDKKDHNILGALQFVAKALEVWFIFLAASLVYDLTMLLAGKGDGLPIGYLMTHVEFSDVMALGERTFWASAKRRNHGGGRKRSVVMYGFVGFVAVLCILANLMGPATAVLVIPSLGWSEVDIHSSQRFEQSGAGNPPRNASIASGCRASALAAGNYTCTDIYSESVDALSASLSASTNQSQLDPIIQPIIPGISQEALVSFTVNFSDSSAGFWIPNRQVLRELSDDYAPYALTKISDLVPNTTREDMDALATQYYNRTIDDQLYDAYRNSLQAVLHREGPTISLNGYCYRGNSSVITLTDDKSIRCFNGSNLFSNFPVKCIREGSGWNEYSPRTRFSINDTSPNAVAGVSVDIFAVERAVYLSEAQIPCSSPEQGSTDPGCQWDLIFSDPPYSDMKNMTQNQQIFQYTIPRSSGANATVWCDSVSYLNFTDYTLDPSPITNALTLISVDTIGNVTGTDPINVHPDWTLAAWSIARGGTISGIRGAAQNLLAALKSVVNSVALEDNTADDTVMDLFALQHFFISTQGVSMIDYTTTPIPDSSHPPKNKDKSRPILKVALSIRVWAYGLGSRTSKLGTAVALVGCAVVIFRAFIGLFTRIKRKRTLELFAAALEHDREGRFEGLSSEHEVAKVRFRTNAKDGDRVVFMPSVRV